MKLPVRIALIILCAALIMALPFVVSSPNMLYEIKMELMNDEEEDEDIDFGRLLFASAKAEDDLEIEELEEGQFASNPDWALPIDFTPGTVPNPELYTEDGYEDESIRVKMEHREFDEGTKIHIAYVQIADASQLRTGVYKPERLGDSKPMAVAAISKMYHPVICINGDNYSNDAAKTTYEYRMGQKIRSRGNKKKDILFIDDKGDFHVFLKSADLDTGEVDKKGKTVWKQPDEWEAETGRKLINAFTFGPALVKDGELLEMDPEYSYNPKGREPRAAIGQTGPLSYVLVIVDSKERNAGYGFSHQKLAELMHELGCVQAYNLDGGNSAEMIFGEQSYKGMPNGSPRSINDIIYFATSQP